MDNSKHSSQEQLPRELVDDGLDPALASTARPAKRRRSRKKIAATALSDPRAMETVARAAEAVGLSVAQLADLFVDGSVVIPPEDQVTQRYTLEDLGMRLWETMQSRPRSARASWFAALLPIQQGAIVAVLRTQGFPVETIAREFAWDRLEINRMWNKHADELGAQVVGLRLNTIAGQMQMAAEKAQQLALQDGDHASFWRIEKDKVGLLQDLGIVDRATQKIEHTHVFDAEKQKEVDQLVELKHKQTKRLEEIKQAEFSVLEEPLPELRIAP